VDVGNGEHSTHVSDEVEAGITVDEFVHRLRLQADRSYRIAREQLQTSANRRKTDYDIRVRRQSFAVGDWVWYFYPRRYKGRSPKWQCCYVGPYKVVRVIEPSNYVIQKSLRAVPFVVHADKMKKCYSDVANLESKFGAPTVGRQQHAVDSPRLPAEHSELHTRDRPVRNRTRPAYLKAYV
jgi:hypothetical protein